MTSQPVCISCGAPTSGPFCGACGAAQRTSNCPGCGASQPAGDQFCLQCGRPRGGKPRTSLAAALPFILGGGVLVAVLVGLLRQERPRGTGEPTPPTTAAPEGSPPDLSQMSPRERFDRLYNRVMTATESGDTTTFTRFTPMALSAYDMLDSVDADARYHAAMLRLHTGDVDGARALADTILVNDPGHLFGFVIRGTLARWERSETLLVEARRDFLAAYGRENAKGRPEYKDHQVILDRFKVEAQGDKVAQ